MGFEYKIKESISENMHKVFIQDLDDKINILANALSKNDIEATKEDIFRVSHFYSGNASYFGLEVLADAAREVTNNIKKKESSDTIKSNAIALYKLLQEVQQSNTLPD